MAPHILIAHYRPDIVSGAENSIADFANQVDARFKITMLVPGEGSLAEFFRQRGLNVWVKRIETPRRVMPGLHQVQSFQLASQLKRAGVQAVIANTFPALSRAGTAVRMAHLPLGVYLRDYTPDTALHRRILQRTRAMFAISRDVIQSHSQMADPSRFHLTYNFINPKPIFDRYETHQNSGKKLLNFTEGELIVGLVGRITPYKQPDLFVRAAAHVLEEVPQARFVLVGASQKQDQPYEARVKAMASALGIADRIVFLGQRTDAVELTSEFSVACLASGREPLGRVILEAHLLGVPVVVPNTGGPAEIVQDEVTGLYFSSQSSDASVQFAKQIVRLLKDTSLSRCLANQAREHVLSTFASRKHVQIQENCFDQLSGVTGHDSHAR